MKNIPRYIENFASLFGRTIQSPEIQYLRFLIEEFVRTRNARVADFESIGMQKVDSIIRRIFFLPIESVIPVFCIDGRVLSETVFGLPFVSFRTPAADISDALCRQDGSFFLKEGDFTQEILERVERFGRAFVILDSHSYCAAKGEEEILSCGVSSLDNGLFQDVSRKKLIADAIQDFSRKKFGPKESCKISVIQVSFDVRSGFLFMGLEQPLVLSDPRVVHEGFTDSVLKELSREGKILSTEVFAKKEDGLSKFITEEIKRNIGTIDFDRDYAESMFRLWGGISEPGYEMLLAVSRDLCNVLSQEMSLEEFRLRSFLLLANGVLGLLLNKRGSYPYQHHSESVVVITNRARGPYEAALPFPVNECSNGGIFTLSFVVGFAASIIRANRKRLHFPEGERRMINESFGEDITRLIKSPVPVFISEQIPEDVPEKILQSLSHFEWSVPQEWADMTFEELETFIRKSIPKIPQEIIESIDRLRIRALNFYRPGLSTTRNFLSGQLALVSTLRAQNGQILATFPFLLSGYSKKYLKERCE
ncbi:MAG: hypothetical protein IPN70_00190 [Candidatus Moraniibacteriota bacterium]|nr:MAG: hypothetical protein IPN70_00190 [Candidatus Moranbacteria bacterium]